MVMVHSTLLFKAVEAAWSKLTLEIFSTRGDQILNAKARKRPTSIPELVRRSYS
jgi:hypothetical protein